MTDNTTHKYLLFPFTHITENDLDTILTFFPQFNYLSINRDFRQNAELNQLFDQKKIIPHFVPSQTLESVEQKFEQYLEWVKIHKGNEYNLKLLLKENPYFTNDSDVTSIKSQLKGDSKEKGSTFSDASYLQLQDNLLFLKMAQLYDEQNENIDLELKNLDKASADLVSNLRRADEPETAIEQKKYSKETDSGTMMARERILAWFRCLNAMRILKQKDHPPLFITTSATVFNYFESNCKDVVNILDIDHLKMHENRCGNRKVWQDQFKDNLMAAIAKKSDNQNELPEVNDQCLKTGQIKICNFFGGEINQVINESDRHISVCLIKLN
jgi:hypothetical protein